MSMFSPAERVVAMRLPSFSSRMDRMVKMRRSSSTSMSTGKSPNRDSSCSGMARSTLMCLTLQIDGFLADLIHGRHHARVGLIGALQHDEVGEFPRDVHRRKLDSAADDGAASSRAGYADGGRGALGAELERVVARGDQGLGITDR